MILCFILKRSTRRPTLKNAVCRVSTPPVLPLVCVCVCCIGPAGRGGIGSDPQASLARLPAAAVGGDDRAALRLRGARGRLPSIPGAVQAEPEAGPRGLRGWLGGGPYRGGGPADGEQGRQPGERGGGTVVGGHTHGG